MDLAVVFAKYQDMLDADQDLREVYECKSLKTLLV